MSKRVTSIAEHKARKGIDGHFGPGSYDSIIAWLEPLMPPSREDRLLTGVRIARSSLEGTRGLDRWEDDGGP